jgi:hypothetical protein
VKIRTVLAAMAGLLVLTTPAAADQDGFLPSSTSWISDRQGAVLGYTPCGTGNLCPKLLATTDGGTTWKPLTAPEVKLPDNHNQVKLTLADARDAFVSDGTNLWATNDGARSWYPVTVTALRSPYYISKVAIAHGKVFAVGKSLFNGDEDYTQIYAAPVGARTLQPIPGYVAKGGINYGDISVDGGVVQVYLGADFADEQYGYSTDGVRFTQAPLPCPVDMTGILGGIRAGKPTVLCNSGGGDPQPGHMRRTVFTAPRIGAGFVASNPAPDLGITQGFGPATAKAMTVAAVGGGIDILHSTFDSGQTWKTTTIGEEGFGLFDLNFVTDRVGFVVTGEPDSGSQLFRSTDAGMSWQELEVSATR